MTILNASIAPSFGITQDEDYESANFTFKSDISGTFINGPVTLGPDADLSEVAEALAPTHIDVFSGTTDSSGLFTVTYPIALASVPTVHPEPPTVAGRTWLTVTSTTTGFSMRLVQRTSVNLLGVDVLLASTSNVVGAAVRAAVIEF